MFDVGDVGRGNIQVAAKTGSRREDVVLAHALDGAETAPVIAEDRPAGLQFRHAHTLSTSSPLTRAYFSSERSGETSAIQLGTTLHEGLAEIQDIRIAPGDRLRILRKLEELMPDRDDFERLDGRISVSPEGAAIRGEQGQRLREAIRSLPPHYRIVIVLRDMEGLTDEEVAEITGLRPETIRVRLHRARLFVRKELAKLNGRTKSSVARRAHRSVEAPSRTGRCKKIFAELSDYLDGQLDDFSCEELETHINGCQPCKKFLRSVANTIKQCRRLPSDRPDPNEAAALRQQILASYSRALANAGR